MTVFILYSLIVLSLVGIGTVVFLKIPALSSLSDEEISIISNKKGVVRKCREINYRHHCAGLIVRLEKFLRKIKIFSIKIENMLAKWISGLRRSSQNMTVKSSEWIKKREDKWRTNRRRKNGNDNDDAQTVSSKNDSWSIDDLNGDIDDDIEIRILTNGGAGVRDPIKNSISISELEKPTKEEQKWIDLIVENPKNITAYKFLGILYWKQHNYVDAKASLEMAVKLGSRDKKVKEILEQIREKEESNKDKVI